MSQLNNQQRNIFITRETSGTIPNVSFIAIKNEILGKKYSLSVLFPADARSRKLHKDWKKKDTPVNILSFPLDDDSGEIIITLAVARTEAPLFDRSYLQHLACLFIHGCAHLKGYTHGHAMEKFEKSMQKKFDVL